MLVSAEKDPRKAGSIWALNIDEPLPFISPRLKTTFRRVGPEAAAELSQAMGMASTEEVVRRYDAGRQCYTAWVNETLVSYGWVSLEEELIGELNLQARLLYGEAYIWDCATLPAYRNQGLYSGLLVHILEELRTQPVCRVWIGANLDNFASQRAIAKAGFHRVADLLVEPALAMRLVWARGCPGVPEDWVDEARRVFLGNREKVWQKALSSAGHS